MNLILLIIAAVFAPMAFASVESWARTILELLIFGAAVATVTRERYIYLSRANKTLIPALLAVALIGLLQLLTQHPVNAPAGSLPFTVWRPHTVDGIVLWCAYAAIVFAAAQAVEHKTQLKLVLWAIFLTGLTVAFMGIFQKTGNDIYIYGFRKLTDFGVPPFGPFINRDNAANYLVTSALCGLGLFLAAFNKYDRFAGRGKQFDFFARQTLLALMLGITIYGIIFTGSRGGIHSFAFAVFIAAALAAARFLRGKNRIYAFGAAALLGVGYIVFVLNSPGLMARTGSQFDNTVLVRLSMYKSGLAMLTDFPLWGTGLNSLMHAFPYYQDFIAVPGTVEHAHSDWLELVLTVGLAGTLAFLAGFAALMYYAVRTALKSMSTEKSIIGICLIGAITAFCVHV